MSYVLAVPYVLRSVIEIGVLPLDVREGVMSDDMLVHPGEGSTKHEADVHA